MKVEDVELKNENAKKIADNWEKLGGWVSPFYFHTKL